jgi:hypothetical protein
MTIGYKFSEESKLKISKKNNRVEELAYVI